MIYNISSFFFHIKKLLDKFIYIINYLYLKIVIHFKSFYAVNEENSFYKHN